MMRVGILGAGESGIGAALLARKLGFVCFVSDYGAIAPGFRRELELNNIPFEEKGHDFERLYQSDFVVKSPGIPQNAEIVSALRERAIPIISEIEFASRHCTGKLLAITGSNGKTTTVSLCHHILQSAHISSALCGNIGRSFARVVANAEFDWYVVEVSSFQLEDIEHFRPDIGILLNITPDHLDRYNHDFNSYANVKMRLAENMREGDVFIYNAADPEILSRLHNFAEGPDQIGVRPDQEIDFELGDELAGMHNHFNAACAIAAARIAGAGDAGIQLGLDTFLKPPHRMEHVATVNDVRYINDSKATNVDSVYYALDAMDRPVIWIAGGQDKGNDYSAIRQLVGEKVKTLICLGIENKNLIEAFSTEVNKVMETTNVFEAVEMAASNAIPGDVVLLSPACASFDLFKNYMERGDLFKTAVLALLE